MCPPAHFPNRRTVRRRRTSAKKINKWYRANAYLSLSTYIVKFKVVHFQIVDIYYLTPFRKNCYAQGQSILVSVRPFPSFFVSLIAKE